MTRRKVNITILKTYCYVLLTCVTMLLLCGCPGCSDAEKSAFYARGKAHHVVLYSGGKAVKEWDSTGMVENEKNSDGYYFQDAATKKMVTISGTIEITVKD